MAGDWGPFQSHKGECGVCRDVLQKQRLREPWGCHPDSLLVCILIAAVPNPLGTRDWFCERELVHGRVRGEEGCAYAVHNRVLCGAGPWTPG